MRKHIEFTPLSGVVSGKLFFTPSHMSRSGGSKVPCRVVFHIRSSIVTSAKINGRFLNVFEKPSKRLRIVAFGKLAEACCLSLSQGRMVDISHTPSRYTSFRNGKEVTKVSFVANNMIFGEETPRQIYSEIERSIRPKHWNCIGHGDYLFWGMMLQSRMSTTPDLQKNMFGFAYIVKSKKVRFV